MVQAAPAFAEDSVDFSLDLLGREQAYFDRTVADIFGFHAIQIGLRGSMYDLDDFDYGAKMGVRLVRIEEAGLNAMQSQRQLFYDGWLLKVSPGAAKRG